MKTTNLHRILIAVCICCLASNTITKAENTTFDLDESMLNCTASLFLTAIFDGPLPNGEPKGIELYVHQDIPDLSIYGIASRNNGQASNGVPEFSFPSMSVTKGTYLYVANKVSTFENFFGFTPDFVSSTVNVNGDDAIELYENTTVIDVYGEVGQDGTGQYWDYQDGWAYRKDTSCPDGSFQGTDWTYSGADALDNASDNLSALFYIPIQTYDYYQLPLQIKIFLGGADNGSEMTTALNDGGYLPLVNPYKSDTSYPHQRHEFVQQIPNGVVDWLLIELRDTDSSVYSSRAAFVTKQGMVVDLDGMSPVTFNAPSGEYWVAVKHRNHLSVLTQDKVMIQ